MKNIRRGQAAIEFLVTYGWAIMAAMIVIGALTYFGMTNPASIMPDKCIFANSFECKDYQITDSAVKVRVINTYGQTIFGLINATCTDDETTCLCIVNPAVGDGSGIDPEEMLEITCTDPPGSPFTTKEKAKVKITMSYYRTASGGYKQISLGEVYATVQ